MKGLISALAAAALLLLMVAGCTRGPEELRSYDVTVGPKIYRDTVYADSTTTLSYGGHVRLQGRFDSIYSFEVKGRHYLGIDDYDDMMSVYTPELEELMGTSRGIHDIFVGEHENGRRHGFIYRLGPGKYGLMDADFQPVYDAEYDSIAICADTFRYYVKGADGKRVSVNDTVEYVRLIDGGQRAIGDLEGRIYVPMQECDRIGVYAEHYYSEPQSRESKENLPVRHAGRFGESEAVMGYAVVHDNTLSFYGLDGALIIPPGALEAWPAYWDDPREARYWQALYRDPKDGTQMEGIFRTDGKTIIAPRHHFGQRIYLRGEDKQVSKGRMPHDIMIVSGFQNGKFSYEYYDYEGKRIN